MTVQLWNDNLLTFSKQLPCQYGNQCALHKFASERADPPLLAVRVLACSVMLAHTKLQMQAHARS